MLHEAMGRALVSVLLVAAGANLAPAADRDNPSSNYGQAKQFLAAHTQVVELTNDQGGRVLICPEYQGRVMTSTLDGDEGLSFGFVCFDFIRQGKNDPQFNNYGGEERFWFSPEGGPFSLWFKPGLTEQTLKDWYTPKGLNEGAWALVRRPGDAGVRMTQKMQLQNASATRFEVDVVRDVRLLRTSDFDDLFGDQVAGRLAARDVKSVGYESVNEVTNDGTPLQRQTGLLSIWMLGMFNSSPKTVVIVPYRPGPESELGPVVTADYFNTPGADRLKVLPSSILLLADAKFRSKIGTSKRRAVDVLGSIDFVNNVLTLMKFSLPEDAPEELYMNNVWGVSQKKPYDGDVVNSYNDGPNDLGSQLGPFYELETLSPARELKTGDSLTHRQATLHIQADFATLNAIAQSVLKTDLREVR